VQQVRNVLPGAIIEVRMDSAFFSDEIVSALNKQKVDFTISVPFERFTELKGLIESRKRWFRIDDLRDYFETRWKPKSWPQNCRFVMVRTLSKQQQKGPVQLDLFEPYDFGWEFKVIVTNKQLQAAAVVDYHDGRGSQEGIFAELKSHCHMDYVPVRTQRGNETYLLAGLFAFNFTRELQMQNKTPERNTTRNRATLWSFQRVDTIRKTILQRAGRLSRPAGITTLTFCSGKELRRRVLQFMKSLDIAA